MHALRRRQRCAYCASWVRSQSLGDAIGMTPGFAERVRPSAETAAEAAEAAAAAAADAAAAAAAPRFLASSWDSA